MDSSVAKASSGAVLEVLLGHVLGPGRYVMMVDMEVPVGAVATTGLPVVIESGCITDCSRLAAKNQATQMALTRIAHRS